MAAGMDKAVTTCLNIDCPERTGGECNANQSVAYTASNDEFLKFIRKMKRSPKYKLWSAYYWVQIRVECWLYKWFGYNPYSKWDD